MGWEILNQLSIIGLEDCNLGRDARTTGLKTRASKLGRNLRACWTELEFRYNCGRMKQQLLRWLQVSARKLTSEREKQSGGKDVWPRRWGIVAVRWMLNIDWFALKAGGGDARWWSTRACDQSCWSWRRTHGLILKSTNQHEDKAWWSSFDGWWDRRSYRRGARRSFKANDGASLEVQLTRTWQLEEKNSVGSWALIFVAEETANGGASVNCRGETRASREMKVAAGW